MAFTVKLITSPTVETGIHVGNCNALLSPKTTNSYNVTFQNVGVKSYHHLGKLMYFVISMLND